MNCALSGKELGFVEVMRSLQNKERVEVVLVEIRGRYQ